MKIYIVVFVVCLSCAMLLALTRYRDANESRSDSVVVGAHSTSAPPLAKNRRDSVSEFGSITTKKLDAFVKSASRPNSNARAITNALSGVPLTIKKVDYIISRLGRENTISYLAVLGREIHDDEISSMICNRFLASEIEKDPVSGIDAIARIGPPALQAGIFSKLLASLIVMNDEESLRTISERLIPVELWPTRADATLIKTLREARGSYEATFRDIERLDPDLRLAQQVAIDYFGDEQVRLDLSSADGSFVLSYLEGMDFLGKEELIESLVLRSSQ